MDKILIRGLKVMACHGVKEFEKTAPQPFIFDADIYYDFSSAYISDDISDTINYSAAAKIIVSTAVNNTFSLIEKLAYECIYALMNALPAQKITLTVYKPHAPIKQYFQTVGVTAEAERQTVYLSLGSSLGDREGYLNKALRLLGEYPQITVKKVSPYIETEPVGGVAQNKFLNCAAEIETYFTPRRLLGAIHKTEEACGRVRDKHWGDRTLDIDIIFFGGKTICEEDLVIPHPEYQNRAFVIQPLKAICPQFVCPVTGKRVKDL